MKICPKCSSPHEKPGTFCSRPCANSRGPRSEEVKQKIREWQIVNRTGFIRGTLSLEEYNKNPRRCVICNNPVERYKNMKHGNIVKTCSKECSRKYRSKCARECDHSKMGGKRHGSGRGKKGYYNGVWCDSTYELAYLIYCQDHNIPIKRYDGWFEYKDINGVTRRYYPDFEIGGVIVEVKGYLTENDHLKMKAVDRPIILMTKKELAPIFEYITSKTGLCLDKYSTLYQSK